MRFDPTPQPCQPHGQTRCQECAQDWAETEDYLEQQAGQRRDGRQDDERHKPN